MLDPARTIGMVPLTILLSVFLLGSLLVNVQPCWIGQAFDASTNHLQWALPYEDPCNCTTVELGGFNMIQPRRPFHEVNLDVPGQMSAIMGTLNCTHKEVCLLGEPLGMEDGRIPDESITASTFYNNLPTHAPQRARLNTQGYAAGWVAASGELKPWIQVDFGAEAIITGLITQGRGSSDKGTGHSDQQWVERYRVKYRANGLSWDYVAGGDGASVEFIGNSDTDDNQVTARFEAAVKARYLRIEVTAYHSHCCMRFEVLGCK